MTKPSILIAGVGNIFMGDDAFGVEVVKRLVNRKLPEGVRVADFGIRGFDLAYALMDGPDVTILVDAAARGGDPGTLYTIEPDADDLDSLSSDQMVVETHGMNPMKVLAMVKSMGGEPRRMLVVGCEPATLGPEEGFMGLSAPVEAAVDEAVHLIESLIAEIQQETISNCGVMRASTGLEAI
jgi:hydrogenase maturation protease